MPRMTNRILFNEDELLQNQVDIEAKIDIIDTNVDDVETLLNVVDGKVDVIDTNVDDIETETDKIDQAVTDGLSGVVNSLAYRVNELERHIHNWSNWFGVAVTPSGTHFADRIGVGVMEFQPDAGNNDWGTWLQLFGADDTPTRAGMVKFDLRRLMVTGVQRVNSHYFVQIGFGTSGADALTAGTYTEFVFEVEGAQAQETPVEIRIKRQDIDTLAWIRTMVPGQASGTMDLFFETHEYPG